MSIPAAEKKVFSLDRLLRARAEAHTAGKTVIHCHGCFDIVHPGHIQYLQYARSLGDILVVSVTSDDGVHKGVDRPLIPDDLRAASLAALVVMLVLIALLQRRRAVRQSLSSRVALQAANDSLEQTVASRTIELHTAQNELVHAGKMAMLGQVSMGMVHELNQPLTAIRTLSDSAHILLDQNRAIEVRGNLQRITGLVDRLARLTSQLKIFAHRSEIQPVAVPLTRSIEDARFIVGEALRKHEINLVLDIAPSDLWVLVEEDALGRILVNLIQNAIDALAQVRSRTLWLVARADQGRVRIEVRDTGAGIRGDILLRLFEPFVSSKPSGAGLGLGLVISAQLVRAVGGKIQAFNREEGGASFLVELPQAAAPE